MRLSVFVSIALSVCLSGGTAFAQIILSDSTFSGANWTALVPASDATFSQVTTGGNPGSFGEITLTNPTPPPTGYDDAVGGLFFSSQLTYNPSVQGAIQSLSFSIDTKSLQGPSNVILAIQQGTSLEYISNGPGDTASSWQSYSEILSLNSVAGFPNFTATGGPIEFGLEVEALAPSAINSVVGIDNLSIKINVAPEPSTLGLRLSAALLGLLLLSCAHQVPRQGFEPWSD